MNYFELFDLPQAPAIDKLLLSKKYFELQKQNHPDFFTQATEAEQEQMLERSAAINKAYNIFRDNQQTIAYFLETVGLIATDEKYNLPPDFLMEMMELNESIAEEKEDAEGRKKVAAYEQKLNKDIEEVLQEYDKDKTQTESLQSLKAYYYKKKYLRRILDRLGD